MNMWMLVVAGGGLVLLMLLAYVIPAQVAEKGAIFFFDGQCGLCNGFVDFVIQRDPQALFQFSPLQSDYATRHLDSQWTQNVSTIVVQTNKNNILLKSDAALYVCRVLGGGWRVCSWLGFIPRSIRDVVYMWIAQNRYAWFGKSKTCRVPTASEQSRFVL